MRPPRVEPRDRSTSSISLTSSQRASRRISSASTISALRGPTTITHGVGPGRATRPSSALNGILTRAAWRTRSSSIGLPGSVSEGGTRHQYVHAIDLLPTLLDLIGIDPPASIAGVDQSPIEGISFAPTLNDPLVPGSHVTQYYEMLGSRALYHDGWKAVVFHSPAFIAYDGTDTTKPFDEDVWELYHVAEDFSEVHDLALTQPAKLKELKELWWEEAEKFQVLPLNNQPGMFGDPRYRRNLYEFLGPVGPLAESIAPNLKNRSFVISADLIPPSGASLTGVIAAHGSHAGGYVMFIEDNRLHFTYNFVATQITTVSAEMTLPTEPVTVRVVFTRTGAGR